MPPSTITTLLWLAPLPPILAFGLIALFFNRSRTATTWIAIGAMLLSCALSFIVVFNVIGVPELGQHPIGGNIAWLPAGDRTIDIGVYVDPLGATFLFMVPLVCSLIFIYSTGYMAADPLYTRFFAYLSLFGGSMMGLVVSADLLSFFIFWELMGFCSYALIGFFYRKPSAYKAAVKAFMTTRVGDMLLLLGMVYLFIVTGTLNFQAILGNEEVLEALAATPAVGVLGTSLGISAAGMIVILIFGGTVGKSAQWPLHVWLPDAMEGPTPVSAMIHAATMVSAGIFLLLRFFPLLEVTGPGSAAFTIVGLIGAFTAFLGATIAIAQYDIKRVLAFSTISQLGFMVAAVGVGAYFAAAFHLLTHAFFKALLFLGSGSVIHGVEHGHHHAHAHGPESRRAGEQWSGHGDSDSESPEPEPEAEHADVESHREEFDPQDMRNMGGLRKRMPITFWTFLIGGLALAGFPILTAGFWSKDEIFADAFHHGFVRGEALGALVFVVLVVSALMTAFYTARQIALTFFGQSRTEAAANAVESSPSITFPLIVLAVFALFIGFTNIARDFPILGSLFGQGAHWLSEFLASVLPVKEEAVPFSPVPLLASLVVALGGLGLGFAVYRGRALEVGVTDPLERLGRLFTFLHRRWYWDELYRAIFINPLQWIADNYTRIVDQGIIDAILEGGYRIGGRIAEGFRTFDRVVVTGFSDTVGRIFGSLGQAGRELQSGQVQNYLLSGLIMALAILAFFLFFFQ
jgi:NADH-quinone oxidoreductase subunit L